jgi:microcystin-dependent protein
MSDTSNRFGIVEPSADRSDSADVPRDVRAVVAALEAKAAQYGQGTLGARPTSSPGTPGVQGRFYMQTDVTPHILHYDFGTGWDPVGAMADGSVLTMMLADGAVTTIKLADGSVTAVKISDGTITGTKIADNTITAAKLVDAIVPSRGASAGTEALRALGTGAGTAAAGNDSRFSSNLVPAGVICAWGAAAAPAGWLLCDGSLVSRVTYSALFTAISTVYGAGDGSTTFALPDLRQRFILGKAASGTGNTLGGTGGNIDHVHAGPSHNHSTPNHTHTTGNEDHTFTISLQFGSTPATFSGQPHFHSIGSSGGGTTGNGGTGNTGTANPPFLALPYIIKV